MRRRKVVSNAMDAFEANLRRNNAKALNVISRVRQPLAVVQITARCTHAARTRYVISKLITRTGFGFSFRN